MWERKMEEMKYQIVCRRILYIPFHHLPFHKMEASSAGIQPGSS